MNIVENRKNTVLDKKVIFEDQIITRREFIALLLEKGYVPKIDQRPLVIFKRRKFNSLDGDEQKEYERKCNTYKDIYILERDLGSDTFTNYEITKIEYDYAKAINRDSTN